MPSNGSSSSPPFTTAGMSVAVYGPMVSWWIVYLRVLYPAVCRVRRKIEAQRADMQPFGGFFRERRCSRACIDHEFEGDAVSAAFDVVVAVGIRFDPNDVVGTLGRARFVTGLQNRGKEGNEARTARRPAPVQ